MNAPSFFTISTSDQHQFQARIFDVADPNAPTLVFLSAMGTPARVYQRYGQAMAEQGIRVITPDWRGIGSSSLRASRRQNFAYRHLVEIDLAALLAQVSQHYPDSSIWLGGHSLGGQLSVLGAAIHTHVSGIVLIASGSVHLQAYAPKLRLGIRTLVALSRITGSVLGYFPGSHIGFAGREARGVMLDWGHVAHHGNYRPHGSSVDYEQALRQLNIPILALNFEADTWSPARSASALLEKLPYSKATQWLWTKTETNNEALDHFSWTKQPALLAPQLARYIQQHPPIPT